MKKTISIITILLVLMSTLTSCSGKNKDKPENTDTKNSTVTTSADLNKDPDEISSKFKETFIDESVGFKINYSYFGSWSYKGLDYLIRGENKHMVFSKYYVSDFLKIDEESIDLTAIKTSEDIMANMFEYKAKMLYSSTFTIQDMSIEYELLETITVDGCEATKFTGEMVCVYSEDYTPTHLIVGYAVLGKNRPMIIWAIDESTDHSEIAGLTEDIDAMILTFEDGE